MKYHHAIRDKLEHEGFEIEMIRTDGLHIVSARKDGLTYMAKAENLTTAFLELESRIREAKG